MDSATLGSLLLGVLALLCGASGVALLALTWETRPRLRRLPLVSSNRDLTRAGD